MSSKFKTQIKNNKTQIANILLILILLLSFFIAYKNYQYKKDIKKIDENKMNDFYIRSKDDLDELLSDGRPSLLFFGSKSCSACIGTKRDAETLYRDFVDKKIGTSIAYIEVTENPELIALYPIQQTPSVLLFNRKGKPQKFTLRDKKDLDIFYKKDEKNKIEYSVFLGIPKLKRMKKAIVSMENYIFLN